MTTLPSTLNNDKAIAVLSKAKAPFIALWKGGEETATTEEIADFYDVTTAEIITTYERHYLEFEGELDGEDGWTPRATLRLGMLLNCPVAHQIRDIALTIIEAIAREEKQEQVKSLFANTEFIGWSNREIAKMLDCDKNTVGRIRNRLESSGEIPAATKRKYNRRGKTHEQAAKKILSGEDSPDTKLNNWITISDDHPHYGGQKAIPCYSASSQQTFVEFADGTRELISNNFLIPSEEVEISPSRNRIYCQEEVEAIIAQHKREIERLEADIRVGVRVEEHEKAISQVSEEITAAREIAKQLREENDRLRSQIASLQSVQLQEENERLKQRIQELEHSIQFTPTTRGEPELHLRAIAARTDEFKSEQKLREVTRLLTMALASVIVNTPKSFYQPLVKPASEILGTKADRKAIAQKLEALRGLPQALKEFREVLSKSESWQEFEPVALKHQNLKREIWGELSQEERNKIKCLKEGHQEAVALEVGARFAICPGTTNPCTIIKIGSGENPYLIQWDLGGEEQWVNAEFFQKFQPLIEINGITFGTKVALADSYAVGYNFHGVVEDINAETEEAVVRWEERQGKPNECERYSIKELRILQTELQVA
ncbi:hypothetical protein BZZ01_05100 [Nostocales cyanobacterium HT-58-2]|nr:hypothetical protein BZZ01_05100 [Nostocales cyanobacterium HT-58-2]